MAFKPTVGYIADAFQGAFRQRLEQAQREREFNQRMNEEQRQSSLLEYWKQKNFQADESYRKANLENQRIDNERQGKIADAQIENYRIDNENQALRTKEMERHNKAIEYQNSLKPTNQETFKGFDNYYKNREKFLGQTTAVPDVDEKGNKTGKYIDAQLTPGEKQANRYALESLAVSELPPNAQSFYSNNFMGKKISQYGFMKLVKDAFDKGSLSEADANALLDINNIRSDWNSIPTGKVTRITK